MKSFWRLPSVGMQVQVFAGVILGGWLQRVYNASKKHGNQCRGGISIPETSENPWVLFSYLGNIGNFDWSQHLFVTKSLTENTSMGLWFTHLQTVLEAEGPTKWKNKLPDILTKCNIKLVWCYKVQGYNPACLHHTPSFPLTSSLPLPADSRIWSHVGRFLRALKEQERRQAAGRQGNTGTLGQLGTGSTSRSAGAQAKAAITWAGSCLPCLSPGSQVDICSCLER